MLGISVHLVMKYLSKKNILTVYKERFKVVVVRKEAIDGEVC